MRIASLSGVWQDTWIEGMRSVPKDVDRVVAKGRASAIRSAPHQLGGRTTLCSLHEIGQSGVLWKRPTLSNWQQFADMMMSMTVSY